MGSTTWTRCVLRLPVAAAATVWILACGGTPPAPSGHSDLTDTLETPSYLFRFAPGDAVDTNWQEAYHAWALKELGVSGGRRITYHKYRDRDHMGRNTGSYSTNAYADLATFSVHTSWSIDNHEVVHLLSSEWGTAVALFSEGFAVAHQMNPPRSDFIARWSGTSVHELVRQFRAAGRFISVDRMATSNDFRSFDSNVTYPESGSFVRFLIDTHGLERMKALFRAGTPSNAADAVRRNIETIYGVPLEGLEREWLEFVERPSSQPRARLVRAAQNVSGYAPIERLIEVRSPRCVGSLRN